MAKGGGAEGYGVWKKAHYCEHLAMQTRCILAHGQTLKLTHEQCLFAIDVPQEWAICCTFARLHVQDLTRLLKDRVEEF